MSRQEVIDARCKGKASFESRAKAREVAKKMRRKNKERLVEYRCSHCRRWHIGLPSVADTAHQWDPRKEQDRPTPERRKRGEWVLASTDRAGQSVAQDRASVPIDRLESAGVLSNAQASAARDFEALYLAAQEVPAVRDSCTIWEPQGHDEGDGPVDAVRDRRELYLFLGMHRDKLLRRVCVEHIEPRGQEVGALREALNECVRFFKRRK